MKTCFLFQALAFFSMVVQATMLFCENPKAKAWAKDLDYLVNRLEIQHPDLYANVEKKVFLEAVSALTSDLPTLEDRKIVFALQNLMALVQDVHTSVVFWKGENQGITAIFDIYPLSFHTFSNGLFISAAPEAYKEMVGCRVMAFNGMATEDLTGRIRNLVSADNPSGRIWAGDIHLSLAAALEYCGVARKPEGLNLTLQRSDGSELTAVIGALPFREGLPILVACGMGKRGQGITYMSDKTSGPEPLYLSRPHDQYWYQYLPHQKLMYVSLLEMEPKSPGDFDRFYDEVLSEFDRNKAEKMVLDIRLNRGGDHYEKPLLKGIIARRDLDRPDKLFVIIGRTVVSASQHFATQFRLYTHATFIGENTGGRPNHYGAQRYFNLPNSGLTIRTSTIYHQDASDWEVGDCTRPDFLTPLSSEDFLCKRDPSMELIYNFSTVGHLKELFKKQLSAAYLDGGFEGLEILCEQFKKEHAKTGVNMGILISDFSGWLFPNIKNKADYTRFLELFTRECPGWTESWFVLARNRHLAEDWAQAARYYEKSLNLFPGNVLARRNLALIRFLLKSDKEK